LNKSIYVFSASIISVFGFAQTAQIKGVVLNEQDSPVQNVLVQAQDRQVYTNANGFYFLEVSPSDQVTIKFQADAYQTVTYTESLKENQSFELNIRLSDHSEELKELVIDKNLQQRLKEQQLFRPMLSAEFPEQTPV